MSEGMYKDAASLTFLYHTLEYSLRDIATLSGYSQQSIIKWFKELEIPTRTRLESLRTERTRAKMSKAQLNRVHEKGLIQAEESRKNSGEGVGKACERKRRERNYFHRESLSSIEVGSLSEVV